MTPPTITCSKTRFGRLELRHDQILTFSSALIGFEKLHRYAVLPSQDCPPLLWLQSVEEPELAFPVVDPCHVFPDYNPVLPPLEALLGSSGPYKLLCILCQERGQLGLNLLAPIVVSSELQKAAQVVLQQTDLKTFRPLAAASPNSAPSNLGKGTLAL